MLVYPASKPYPEVLTVNGKTAVPFWSIEPVKVSVDSVPVAVGVVTAGLELEPHPSIHTIETIDNAKHQGRTKRVVSCIGLPSFWGPVF
jgi:hypothetical protein